MRGTIFIQTLSLLALAGLLAGCGGGQAARTVVTSPKNSGSVVIAPPFVFLGPDGPMSFGAIVNGQLGQGVVWSVIEGPRGGTIDNFGNYVAPDTTGVYNVQAVSVADPSLRAEALVTVLASGFTATGSMTTYRALHGTTLLPDGTVLVTGGMLFGEDFCIQRPCDAFWNTAEIYSPASREWAATTGLMVEPRAAHTMTLLQNGQVLLAGGFHGDDSDRVITSTTAEIYDPSSENFKSAGNLAHPRYAHTATQLVDGTVLIVGGQAGEQGALRSAELYDPATGAFTATGSMAQGRFGQTSTLLASGQVLIVGGRDDQSSLFGHGRASSSAELYHPASGQFKATGSMSTDRAFHTATLLPDGRVLITGGEASSGLLIATAEIYDPASGTFAPAASMTDARARHSATLLQNGKVLITGAGGDSNAERYDPMTRIFTVTGGMADWRSWHTAILLPNGDPLVAGGLGGSSGSLKSAEIYR